METMAMAMMVPQEKLEMLRNVASQISVDRRAEFRDFLKRYSTEVENWYLQSFGESSIMICYLQGNDLKGAFTDLASSQHRFDLWVKAINFDIFGIDFNQANDGPTPEVLLEVNANE